MLLTQQKDLRVWGRVSMSWVAKMHWSIFFNKNVWFAKKQVNVTHTFVWLTQMWLITGNIVCIWGKQKYWFNRQKLQSRLYTYVQNTEKIMFEELKEGIVTMSHQEQWRDGNFKKE